MLLCSGSKWLSCLTQDAWLGMNAYCFLLLLAACQLIHSHSVCKLHSYFVNILTQLRWIIENEWLLFSPLATVWTCAFTCTQEVSLRSYQILTRWIMVKKYFVALFSISCCINVYIHLCSGCKLLSCLVNILTQDVWLRMNCCSFLHLMLCERVHSLVLRM